MGLLDIFKKAKSDVELYYESKNGKEIQVDYSQVQKGNDTYVETPVSATFSGDGFRFVVDDVFNITGRGTVVTGRVQTGSVKVGQEVRLQRVNGASCTVTITGIEQFRKMCTEANAGDNVGILIRGIQKSDIGRGDALVSDC